MPDEIFVDQAVAADLPHAVGTMRGVNAIVDGFRDFSGHGKQRANEVRMRVFPEILTQGMAGMGGEVRDAWS